MNAIQQKSSQSTKNRDLDNRVRIWCLGQPTQWRPHFGPHEPTGSPDPDYNQLQTEAG